MGLPGLREATFPDFREKRFWDFQNGCPNLGPKMGPKNMNLWRFGYPNGGFGEQKGENDARGVRKHLDRPLSPQPNPKKRFSREKSKTRKPPGPPRPPGAPPRVIPIHPGLGALFPIHPGLGSRAGVI